MYAYILLQGQGKRKREKTEMYITSLLAFMYKLAVLVDCHTRDSWDQLRKRDKNSFHSVLSGMACFPCQPYKALLLLYSIVLILVLYTTFFSWVPLSPCIIITVLVFLCSAEILQSQKFICTL